MFVNICRCTMRVRKWLNRGCCFSKHKMSHRATYQLILQSYYIYPPRNGSFQACLRKTAASLPSLMVERKSKSSKLEADCHVQTRTTWFLWKEGVKPSDIESRLCVVCGNKAPAGSTVSNWIGSFSSFKQTARAHVYEWYRNTHKESFREAIRKFRRRSQRYSDYERNMLSYQLFSI